MTATEEKTPGQLVQDFVDTFQPPNTPEFWRGLMDEEFKELREAAAALLKELADVLYVTIGYQNCGGPQISDDQLPAGSDLLAFLMENLPNEMIGEAFARVHESNMSKVGDDGKPIRRPEDGKILKGPNYKAPDLSDLI